MLWGLFKNFSNQIIAGRSKWFVGSSSSNSSGFSTNNLDNSARIFHPPEKSFILFEKSVLLNPKPFIIFSELISNFKIFILFFLD